MLKTNTKKARENIRAYILANFTPYDGDEVGADFPEVAEYILRVCRTEKQYSRYSSALAMFTDWAQGLPSVLDTCYYYNRSAVDDLGGILEETQAERERFTETQAENLLTRLIFREIITV